MNFVWREYNGIFSRAILGSYTSKRHKEQSCDKKLLNFIFLASKQTQFFKIFKFFREKLFFSILRKFVDRNAMLRDYTSFWWFCCSFDSIFSNCFG